MSYDLNYSGSTQDEQSYVAWLMQLFSQARTRRLTFEVMWEESAALCWPEFRNSFSFGHVRPPGQKYTEFQIDTAGSIASHRFMALCDALITPHNMMWSQVRADNDDLMRDRSVQLYYDQVSQVLWDHRYRPEANFFSQNQLNWQALGVFGNMGMYIDEYDSRPGDYRPGLRYCATSPGEIYILRNHQGRENGHIRHFRWSARQAVSKWGLEKVGPVLRAAVEKNSQELWDFLQFVLPNTEYDPLKIFSYRDKPWVSVYVAMAGYCILDKGGYRSYPRAGGGYMRAPEEDYDRGPAQMCLPALKTLNAMKAMFLRAGHKAAEPAYLIADDGLVDLKTAPNSFNYGGLSENGNKLVEMLETGTIQVTQEMMQEEAKNVNDCFLVGMFPLLMPEDSKSQKSARQVIEEANDRGMFLAPTLGRQYSDYIPTMIDRELDILAYMSAGKSDDERAARHLLPRAPDVLKEAQGEYKLRYQSPLSKAMDGQGIASYMRMIEMSQAIIQAGGDPSIMDQYDFDVALPDMAEKTFVPARYMADPKKVAARAKQRAQQQQQENYIKSLPGLAAKAKADAIAAKAATGGNIGGTLSGTPQGGMPQMPGQAQPGGRAFGQPG